MISFYFVICVDQEGDADWVFLSTRAGAEAAAHRMNETSFDAAEIYKVTLPGLDLELQQYERKEPA